MIKTRAFFVILSFFAFLCVANAQAQPQLSDPHVRINVVPEKNTVEPGDTIFIAFDQTIDPHWHTYWVNPGDSGAPMYVMWDLPQGFSVGDIKWPVPKPISMGPLTNFGYENRAIPLQSLSIPADLPDGPFTLTAQIETLVCADICIPEFSEHEITFNAGQSQNNSDVIESAFDMSPIAVDWPATYSEKDGKFVVKVTMKQPQLIAAKGETLKYELLPFEWGVINNAADTDIEFPGNKTLILTKDRGDRDLNELDAIRSLFTFIDNDGVLRAIEFTAKPDNEWISSLENAIKNDPALQDNSVYTLDNNKTPIRNGSSNNQAGGDKAQAISGDQDSNQEIKSGATASESVNGNSVQSVGTDNLGANNLYINKTSFLVALISAFVGGLVLNLMPCVFPVLSMKAISLCRLSDKEKSKARLSGIAYTLGVLVSFAGIAAVLIVLTQAGEKIGWGFQFQNPLVVMGLAYLLFVLGLNLSGLFEFGGSLANTGGALTQKSGFTGSFFTGVLATIVATPCTAPFMGVAVGYAATQPPMIALSVFLMLGFGLAFPYLIVSFIPAFYGALPKPGVWMERFKEFMAFFLYASVIWLIYVFISQTGTDGLVLILSGLLALSFSIWVLVKLKQPILGWLLIIVTLAISYHLKPDVVSNENLQNNMPIEAASATDNKDIEIPFTLKAYETALAGNDPLFVNMTAAWCITCKLNEKVVLKTDEIQNLFKSENITYLQGDWTNRNDEITQYLNGYGRNGVPLYVFYGERNDVTGKRPKPIILPQILTPDGVKDVFLNTK